MDEYVGLAANHDQSYHNFMYENLFKHVDIDPINVHILDGNAADLDAECAQFEKKILDAGGIHLFVGGIGTDGHIAFNEPGQTTTLLSLNELMPILNIVEPNNRLKFGFSNSSRNSDRRNSSIQCTIF
jgi:6-phosphogluconolactonase/glucosamine-6-phosphate isomerase/deaminase